MSVYVLDTDSLTLYQDAHANVCRQVLLHANDTIATSVISVEEQLSGWCAQLRQAKSDARLEWAYGRLADNVRFLSRLTILRFALPAIRRYNQLRKQNLKLGKLDLRIAAVVLEEQATLVTRNSRDFKQVPGLQLEDWSQ
jgi:tRNA(fMet)-specific endonuclease VapC